MYTRCNRAPSVFRSTYSVIFPVRSILFRYRLLLFCIKTGLNGNSRRKAMKHWKEDGVVNWAYNLWKISRLQYSDAMRSECEQENDDDVFEKNKKQTLVLLFGYCEIQVLRGPQKEQKRKAGSVRRFLNKTHTKISKIYGNSIWFIDPPFNSGYK